MAKDLAREVGYIYIDSGAMYRAVTLYCMEQSLFQGDTIDIERLRAAISQLEIGFKLNPATGLPETYLNGQNVEQRIRSLDVSERVSPVSAIDFVREALVRRQQALGKEKGIVMDGRDIGTTVFPDAELKIFVTASPEVRARRRFEELKAKGENVNIDEVLANVMQRDQIDQNRSISPLRQAPDALVLDNTHLSIVQQKAWLIEQFQRATR